MVRLCFIDIFSNFKSLNNGFRCSGFEHAVGMLAIVWVLSLVLLSVFCLSVLSALLLWCGSLRNSPEAVLSSLHFCHKRTCLGRQEGWRLFLTENRGEGKVSLGWWDESGFPQLPHQSGDAGEHFREAGAAAEWERECSVVARILIFFLQSPERFKSLNDFEVPLESCVLLLVLTVWQFWQFGFLKIV